jgi:NAD(P)-dependent dehydrogenase (short-subunit alcohol dehydrogenase family)
VRDAQQSNITSFPAPDGAVPTLSEADHSQHPVGRVGKGEDIARLAWFLLDSEQSGFITGEVIYSLPPIDLATIPI